MSDFELTKEQLPVHIGIIMDGNGRWAKKRRLPRTAGHTQGAKVFKRTVQDCRKLGIKNATFYAFSTENWKRPREEVEAIMKLLVQYLDDIKAFSKENVRIIFPGDKSVFPDNIKNRLIEIEQTSLNNDGFNLLVALNYGGRDEIVNAAKNIAKDYKEGIIGDIDSISEQQFENYLYTKGIPNVDLMVRPSGEMRLSNFLIWQCAYAEFVFMDVLWPDFTMEDLTFACREYAKRNRRFGGV